MNLYNKYRPADFDSIIGNEAEVEAFKEQLVKKSARTFLLTGPAGCGKTTLARIAASKLGATDLSITEINSANNRGIDTAREIIDQMQYRPMGSPVRVFLIDEVHQCSKDWQEAMLKPLEDTPEHVYFFLCTTDPAKLKESFKSRCTQVKVNALNDEALYRLLRKVSVAESFTLSKESLQYIASNSNGSPRTALVLLEKCSSAKDDNTIKEIVSMGEAAERETIELCRILMGKPNWGDVSEILKGLKDVEPEKCRMAVLGYMNSVLLKGGSRKAALIIELFSDPFWNNGKAGLSLACFKATLE